MTRRVVIAGVDTAGRGLINLPTSGQVSEPPACSITTGDSIGLVATRAGEPIRHVAAFLMHFGEIGMGLRTWLGLRKRSGGSHPVKLWPASLAESHEGPIVTFGISLRSEKTSRDWRETQALLGATLRSVFRQTDPRWRVIVCGHEVPDIPELADPRLEFVALDFAAPPPQSSSTSYTDRWRKRLVIGARLREVGAGFYMDLDSDDLIHRDLVAIALSTEHGCVITTGYICDAQTDLIAPLPGVLSVDFDRICGSMAVVRYERDDLPSGHDSDVHHLHFSTAIHHGYLRGTREEVGKPLVVVPFAAGIYVINTQDNLSFIDQRIGEHRSHLLSRVRALAITDEKALRAIAENFG